MYPRIFTVLLLAIVHIAHGRVDMTSSTSLAATQKPMQAPDLIAYFIVLVEGLHVSHNTWKGKQNNRRFIRYK